MAFNFLKKRAAKSKKSANVRSAEIELRMKQVEEKEKNKIVGGIMKGVSEMKVPKAQKTILLSYAGEIVDSRKLTNAEKRQKLHELKSLIENEEKSDILTFDKGVFKTNEVPLKDKKELKRIIRKRESME